MGLAVRAAWAIRARTEDRMKLRYALLAATLITAGISGVALAQKGPVYDPAQLPEVKGKVAQYLLTPRGDVDGFLLADGTEVHVAPHLSAQLVFSVKPGDAVTIHGLKAKEAPLVLAASVTNDATGTTLLSGPPGRHGGPSPAEATGKVKAQLHSPHGDVDGVLLEDGTIIRLPPPEAQKFSAELADGKTVFARGFGSDSPLGKVVAATALGVDKDHTQPVAFPHPGGPGFGPGEHMHGHGPWHGGPEGGPGRPGPEGPGAPPPPAEQE